MVPDRTQLLAWAPHDVELAGGCGKYVHMAPARRLRGGHGRVWALQKHLAGKQSGVRKLHCSVR